MNAVLSFFRGPACIAIYTYREGIRKKVLIGFLVLSLLVIFGSSFISSFLDPSSETDIDLKLIKDICVAAISIFGVLITIYVSASVVPGEVENKVIYTILSKPVRRLQYLLGKFLGAQLIIIVNLLLMGILFFMALYLRQGVMPTLLLWSLLLTYFQFLIVSAFTFALSCAATSRGTHDRGTFRLYYRQSHRIPEGCRTPGWPNRPTARRTDWKTGEYPACGFAESAKLQFGNADCYRPTQ